MKKATEIKLNRVNDLRHLLRTLSSEDLPETEHYSKRISHAVMAFSAVQGRNRDIKAACSECGGFCCIGGGNHLHIADVLVLYYTCQTAYIPQFYSMKDEADNCTYLTDTGCSAAWKPMICTAFFCNRLGKKHHTYIRLGASLRAAMEALVKIFKFELGEINELNVKNQAEFVEDFARSVFEVENNEKDGNS